MAKHVQKATLTIGGTAFILMGDLPANPPIDESVEETEVPADWSTAAGEQYVDFIYGAKTRGTVSFTLKADIPFTPPVTKCQQTFVLTLFSGTGECGETPTENVINFNGVITERTTGTLSIDGERVPTCDITVRVQAPTQAGG